jgi:hypothetical protein
MDDVNALGLSAVTRRLSLGSARYSDLVSDDAAVPKRWIVKLSIQTRNVTLAPTAPSKPPKVLGRSTKTPSATIL